MASCRAASSSASDLIADFVNRSQIGFRATCCWACRALLNRLQGAQEVAGVLGPVVGLSGDARAEQAAHLRRDGNRLQRPFNGREVLELLLGQALDEEDTHGVDVPHVPDVGVELGRCVRLGVPACDSLARGLLLATDLRDAEVRQHRNARVRYEDVLRLDVAVLDLLQVRVRQRVDKRQSNFGGESVP